MLTSIATILMSGLFGGWIFKKLKLPGLLGMIIAGVIISPYALNLIDEFMLNISADIRQIALVIILTRAGLSLDISDLKKVGRPAVLLCFVPACIEMLGTIILAPLLFDISVLDAAIIGSVIAAVSPAVVVPRMIKLIDEGYGKDKSIPQMILAGASVDDVFVIVIFTALTSLASTGNISAMSFVQVPVSIVLGILLGICVGLILSFFFNKVKIDGVVKVMIMLCVSFLMLEIQDRLADVVSISGLLGIMSMGIVIKEKHSISVASLSAKYNNLWKGAEVFLFVLVGAAIDLRYVKSAGVMAILLVLGALIFRMSGVALSLVKTKLNRKERLFCMAAYTPKATVQAAIGAIPLTMGLSCGNLVLTVAVLSILITAPFGAICIDKLYDRVLKKSL